MFSDYLSVMLSDSTELARIYSHRKEKYTIRKLKESKKETMGRPLSPDDIEELKKDGTLEDVILSDTYMTDCNDYETFGGTLFDLYGILANKYAPTVSQPYEEKKTGFSLSCLSYGVTELMKYPFNKKGVTAMLDSLSESWLDRIEYDDVEFIKINIDGREMSIPLCADNANQLAFMLKDMLIADRTGEATVGNLKEKFNKTDKEFEELDDRWIYKIYHRYTKPEYKEQQQRFVKTNLTVDELEEIYAGFEMYIEENTRYGESCIVTEDVFAHFLCEFYGCELVTNSVEYEDSIDIYYAREGHRYPCNAEYIQDFMDSEFVRKVKAYFDDEAVFGGDNTVDELSADEIMEKYA